PSGALRERVRELLAALPPEQLGELPPEQLANLLLIMRPVEDLADQIRAALRPPADETNNE
ncbi:hypothetical protein SE17_18180, partial [Kouleothrix aurantiaca]